MSAQRDPNKVAVMCYIPLDVVTKIKTIISGKKIPNKVCKGRTIRKQFRSMGVSNFIIQLAEEAVKGVSPAASDIKWQKSRLRKNLAIRKIADDRVKSGEEKMKARKRIFEKTGRMVVGRKEKCGGKK